MTKKQADTKKRNTGLRKKGLCVCCAINPATERISGGSGYSLIKYCVDCRTRINLGRSARRLQNKTEVLAHYGKEGKAQCCWDGCSVTDPDMLTLDHKLNNGNTDRNVNSKEKGKKALQGGITFYAWLKTYGYPEGFQTLCHNHQWKKEILRRRADINGTPTWK